MNEKKVQLSSEETLKARAAAKALFDWDDSERVDEEWMSIMRTLHKESDRGCVLVAVSILDESLESLLRSRMSSSARIIKSAVNDLFDRENAPLSSFWAKIKTSYSFGFINQNIHDALEMIRRLRNSFAHKHVPSELSDKVVVDLMDKLEPHEQMAVRAFSEVFSEWATEDFGRLREVLGGSRESLETIFPIPRGFGECRLRFIMSIALIWSNLKKIEFKREGDT